jgi:hypothetical protein
MNGRGSYRDRLEQWLDEGPSTAPHDLLEDILTDFPVVGQHRRLASFGPVLRLGSLAVAASVLLFAAGFAVRPLVTNLGSGGAVPTPGWADRFPSQAAALFARPFEYAIDPTSGLTLREDARGYDMYQFRAPSPSDPELLVKGVIVRTAGGGLRAEPCRTTGGPIIRDPSAREFVDYLRSVPGLAVADREAIAVDRYRALVVDVHLRTDRPCRDLWVFDDKRNAFTETVGETTLRRFVALDVDGMLVLLVAYSEDGDPEDWFVTAQAFIDTIDFRRDAPESP